VDPPPGSPPPPPIKNAFTILLTKDDRIFYYDGNLNLKRILRQLN